MMTKQQGSAQLLEPWYQFRLMVTQDQVGRAMNDIQRMSGEFETPDNTGGTVVTLTGSAPVAEMQGYAQTVNAYTHGQGELECVVDGYRPCHNADEVITDKDYNPVADLENTPDSVFLCAWCWLPSEVGSVTSNGALSLCEKLESERILKRA